MAQDGYRLLQDVVHYIAHGVLPLPRQRLIQLLHYRFAEGGKALVTSQNLLACEMPALLSLVPVISCIAIASALLRPLHTPTSTKSYYAV